LDRGIHCRQGGLPVELEMIWYRYGLIMGHDAAKVVTAGTTDRSWEHIGLWWARREGTCALSQQLRPIAARRICSAVHAARPRLVVLTSMDLQAPTAG